ncbi:MAG: CesT family type III secretion system chaperone [Puniceicoccales bacterium]|jgi:hypothetical protein|nr:CesT family type III secretion system chaperone [Puniceicoccales bacterium]
MKWMEAIELLARYFRVKDHDPNDPVCEVMVDERLELKITHLDQKFLAFFGYFTGMIGEGDWVRLKHMLQWNFARIAETYDTLSLESESHRLCLFRKWPLEELFKDNIFGEVESFIANLEFWTDAFDYTKEVPRGSNLTVFGF